MGKYKNVILPRGSSSFVRVNMLLNAIYGTQISRRSEITIEKDDNIECLTEYDAVSIFGTYFHKDDTINHCSQDAFTEAFEFSFLDSPTDYYDCEDIHWMNETMYSFDDADYIRMDDVYNYRTSNYEREINLPNINFRERLYLEKVTSEVCKCC